MAASHRRQQNLRLYEAGHQERFYRLMRFYKSIGQRTGSGQTALRPTMQKRRVLDGFVYRFDEASAFDWEKATGGELCSSCPRSPRRAVVL